MNFIVQAATDIGISKKTNQDSYNVRVFSTRQGKIAFAIMCDGMGGLDKGEVASASLVHAFCKWADERLPFYCENGMDDISIKNDWFKIIREYSTKIKLYAKAAGSRMGTTVTAMLLTGERYYILNIGDTRAYEITDAVKRLTKDQTVVARQVELGNMTEEEAEKNPKRSVLLQCVGASDVVYPDMFYGTTKKDTVYMLCTDGFRHEITENEIFQYLKPENMADEEIMKENMKSLIAINKERKEKDNISVIAIRSFD